MILLICIICQIILNLFSAKSINTKQPSNSFNLSTTTTYNDINDVRTCINDK